MTESHLYAGPHPPHINPNLAIEQRPLQRCRGWVIDILRCMSFVYVATVSQALSLWMTSRPSLYTPLDLRALHEWLLSRPWLRGISAEDVPVKIASGVKWLGRCGRQLEVVCPAHWFHRDPVALYNYWSIPLDPCIMPIPHQGLGSPASMWPSLKEKSGILNRMSHITIGNGHCCNHLSLRSLRQKSIFVIGILWKKGEKSL